MFIQTEATPNPDTLKFIPDQAVMKNGGNAEFTTPEEAAENALAQRLFALAGVARVFLGADFIAVSKTPNVEWPQIKADILGVIVDFFAAGIELAPSISTPHSQSDDLNAAKKIEQIIETRIRPAVAQDGGDIYLERFEKGVAYLKMRGACAGCPSAAITLKQGVENLLRYYVPELERVEANELL